MDWVLLERNLPQYQFRERHRRLITAPPETVWRALHAAKVAGSPLTRGAVALRMLPARLAGRAPARTTLFDLSAMGSFLRLGEISEQELILGMIGEFWRPKGGLVQVEAAQFAAHDDPAVAKLVWGFRLDPDGQGTLLRTETRVYCPSAATLRRFRPYWYAIRPVSGLIRREILKGIAIQAYAMGPAPS
jgi:hypothetical protein